MPKTKTEWYFIVNPRAGSGKTMSKWVPAEKKLDRYGIPYVTSYTDHRTHAIELAYEAASSGFRRIAAVGGDGSVHEVLSGILKFCSHSGVPTEEFTIAVVPIGSGNDWIKSLDIPNNVEHVIDLMASESFGKMDVVDVITSGGKKSAMANIGGIGFDSHVCKRVNLQKESGMRHSRIYLNALLNTIGSMSPINVCIMADGRELFKGACYSIALGNGRYSGSGMKQVPLADNNDGILDVMIVPKLPLFTIITQLPRLFNGTANECDKLITSRFKTLEIIPLDNASNDIVEMDGELVGRLPLCVRVSGHKINVIHG